MKAKFVYVGIRVKNMEESIKFYTELFEMKIVGRNMFPQTKGEIVYLRSEESDFSLELNYYQDDSPYNTEYIVGEGLDHLAFKVDDLEKALEEAKQYGYPNILVIGSVKTGWAYIEDPNGIWIELY